MDSGGAFLPRQDEVFPDRDHFGRIFFNQVSPAGPVLPPPLSLAMNSPAFLPAHSPPYPTPAL